MREISSSSWSKRPILHSQVFTRNSRFPVHSRFLSLAFCCAIPVCFDFGTIFARAFGNVTADGVAVPLELIVQIDINELDPDQKWRGKHTILEYLLLNEQPTVFEAHMRKLNGQVGKRIAL